MSDNVRIEPGFRPIPEHPTRVTREDTGGYAWVPGQALPERDLDLLYRHRGKPIVLRPCREDGRLHWIVCVMRAPFRTLKLRTFHYSRFEDAKAYAAEAFVHAEALHPDTTLAVYGLHGERGHERRKPASR